MSVPAVHCCKLVREKIICMWAPQLLSYCNPVSVRAGGTFSRDELQNKKSIFFISPTTAAFSSHAAALTCAHQFSLRTKAKLT